MRRSPPSGRAGRSFVLAASLLVAACEVFGKEDHSPAPTSAPKAAASASAASRKPTPSPEPGALPSALVRGALPAAASTDRAALIGDVATQVEARYATPKTGERMAAAIRAKAAKGGYDAVKSDVDLATAVTQDLRAASHEQRTTLEFDGPGGSSPDKSLTLREAKSRTEHGFGVGGRLPGNIERMVIRSFEPVDDTRDAVEDHFAKAADADGLLLDLTECTGGDPATVAYVVSYLVGSGTRIHLVDTTWRNTGTTEATWTEPSPPGRTFVHKPVVVLTSSLTTTACEEMAYDLRALHRATMVGETTAGVADPVALERVAPMFVLRFPVGRLTSAITHKSWEGVGVVPDEQVPPQETMQKGYIRLLRALIASPALPQGTRNGLKMALKAMGGE